jgi:hypothetical protein
VQEQGERESGVKRRRGRPRKKMRENATKREQTREETTHKMKNQAQRFTKLSSRRRATEQKANFRAWRLLKTPLEL